MWYPPNTGGNGQDLLRSQCLIIECVFIYLVFVWALIFLFFGVRVSLDASISLKIFKCVYVYMSVYMFVQFLKCMFELWFLCFLVYVFLWKLRFVLRALIYLSFDFLGVYVSIFIYLNFDFLVVQFFLGLCVFLKS